MICFCPGRFPLGLDMRLSASQCRSEHCGEETNLGLLEIEPQS
jgi:hypothetical protein